MINVNDAGRVLRLRRRERRARAGGAAQPQPRAARAAALREALDRRRRNARNARRHGAGRARGDAKPASKSSTRPTRTSPSRCSSPTTAPRAPSRRCTTSSPSGRRPPRPSHEGTRTALHRDDHAVRRDTAPSTSPKPSGSRSFLVDRGNDGVVVSGTTGESPALENDEKLELFASDQDGAGASGHRHRRDDREQHAPLGRTDEGGGEDRRRRAFSPSCPYYNKPTAGRAAAPLRRDRRGDVAAGRPLQHPRPHGRRTCCPPRCTSWRAATRTSSGSKNRPATSSSSPHLVRDRVREDFTVWCGRRLLLSAGAGAGCVRLRRASPDIVVQPRAARDGRCVRRAATSQRPARIHRELAGAVRGALRAPRARSR